ncbi:hypothetical protein ABEB36_012351 [Hypothenemus hampei]
MSSTQEPPHLLPQTMKSKMSPLELRNTDLVSRLLAATPPYLYNMSLLPNTYFFSEMLRGLVQAKNEQRSNVSTTGYGGNNAMFYGHHQARRSRKRTWNHLNRETFGLNHITEEKNQEKPVSDDSWMIKSSAKKTEDRALELTTSVANHHQKIPEEPPLSKPPKIEDPPSAPFPPLQQENNQNLVLPPPPPMWYPPIYPTPPYGIDPLHFFIDLRVSGHIYDRQTKETKQDNCTVVSPKESSEKKEQDEMVENVFKQKRHCSAFSVPNTNGKTKFDVKSMGLDKSSNKTSTTYVMGNIADIYKNVKEKKIEEVTTIDVEMEEDKTVGEDKQKKVKDLRALIGLELVVDYMSHKKALIRSHESSIISEEGDASSELDSCSSPPLEVVAVHDEV